MSFVIEVSQETVKFEKKRELNNTHIQGKTLIISKAEFENLKLNESEIYIENHLYDFKIIIDLKDSFELKLIADSEEDFLLKMASAIQHKTNEKTRAIINGFYNILQHFESVLILKFNMFISKVIDYPKENKHRYILSFIKEIIQPPESLLVK
jgi:hypothetical protein